MLQQAHADPVQATEQAKEIEVKTELKEIR